ncbi:MAG: GNAT family N-acetyltransferase [Patescibacteria group bacterium UBA2163]
MNSERPDDLEGSNDERTQSGRLTTHKKVIEKNPGEDKEKAPASIEEAQPEDARSITTLLYKTWMDTYPNEELGITEEQIEEYFAHRLSEEGIQSMARGIERIPPNTKMYVVKVDNEIVGVARGATYDDNNTLHSLYIDPDHQDKSLGYLLFSKIQTSLDSSKDTYLGVATYNQKAIDFYTRQGFVPTGKVKEYKKPPHIPEMEMVLKADASQETEE